MALQVIAHFHAQPAQLAQAQAILLQLAEVIRRDAGCLRCSLAVQTTDPHAFVYIEEWRDDAALEQHLQDDLVLQLVNRVESLLSQPFTLQRYRAA